GHGQHTNTGSRPQNGSVGLDANVQAGDPAGAAAAVIGHGQQPGHGAGGAFADKVVQAARSVGGPAEKEQPAVAVVIDEVEEGVGHPAIAVMVVQDGEVVCVSKVSDQITYGLVDDIVGDNRPCDSTGWRGSKADKALASGAVR